jgi:hypothetical protein
VEAACWNDLVLDRSPDLATQIISEKENLGARIGSTSDEAIYNAVKSV